MSKPIPDEALRRAVQAMAAGDKISLLTEAGHETILVKQVFSELLALREAARFAWGGLRDIEEGRDGPGEKWCAEACRNIEALLPEESK